METFKLDRRDLLARAGGFAAATILAPIIASCTPRNAVSGEMQIGSGERSGDATARSVSPWAETIAVALRIEYFAMQFYAIGTMGAPATHQAGSAVPADAAVRGGHRVAFKDPLLAQHARELSADKIAHVARLRDQLDAADLVWPEIDFEATPDSPFSLVAQQAGLVRKTEVFDPFRDDESFLLTAFLLEDGMAATYRGMIDNGPRPTPEAVSSNLADSIFEGGLIRSLIASTAEPGSWLALSMAALSKFIAHLDGSDLAGTSPANGSDQVMSVEDASGVAIPITRMLSQFTAGTGLLIVPHQ